MKKVQDWDIKIKVQVSTCKQSFSMVCSVHTRVQQIVLRVCKLLEFDRFDTKMEIFAQHYIPMKPTSTLMQNGVKTGDTLLANVLNTTHKEQRPVSTPKRPSSAIQRKESKCYGLTLVCSCVEPKCVNYQKQQLVPVGFGDFKFYDLIKSRKCNVCPYRSQNHNKSMATKEVKLNNCSWKVSGTHHSSSFPTKHDTGFRKTLRESDMGRTLDRHKWSNDINLCVKDL